MKLFPPCSWAAGCVGVVLGLQVVQAQEKAPVVLVSDTNRFLYTADALNNLYVSGHPPREVGAPRTDFGLYRFGITLQTLPPDATELPDIKMEFHGTSYVLPARKIVVVAAQPKQQGFFAQVARDPNGTGNCEVMLTINWSDWPNHEKHIEFLSNLLPREVKVISNGGASDHPDGGLRWRKSLVLRNETDHPFILDQGYFENLPTNEGWPLIEVPPVN